MNNPKVINLSAEEVNYLLSPKAIRDQSQAMFERLQAGNTFFDYHPAKVAEMADFVLEVINDNYPKGDIPFHSRWGHFMVGGIDRVAKEVDPKLKHLSPIDQAKAKLDLVITSVLLDAGAGSEWKYFENSTQKSYNRSEGLGVASLYLFLSGAMSSQPGVLQVDANGLEQLTLETLGKAFQVSHENPLLGLEGRLLLLKNLSKTMQDPKNARFFANGRPSDLLDYNLKKSLDGKIKASDLLRSVLDALGPIWPGRLSTRINNEFVNLGDIWQYPELKNPLVPLHKLSQWLTYSLIGPIEECKIPVTGVEHLTGLAEYRNGGLLLDGGILSLKNPSDAKQEWTPDSPLIIEWRSLTIYFLDQIGKLIQDKLKKSPSEFPLGKVLEGGTWHAGRRLAFAKRPNGNPPLMIKSDGTVF